MRSGGIEEQQDAGIILSAALQEEWKLILANRKLIANNSKGNAFVIADDNDIIPLKAEIVSSVVGTWCCCVDICCATYAMSVFQWYVCVCQCVCVCTCVFVGMRE